VKIHTGQAPASDLQHLWIQVQPFDLVAVPQQLKVLARATGDVEKPVSVRTLVRLDQLVEPGGLGRIVLPRVSEVVETLGLPEDARRSSDSGHGLA
jgi:hypothetical protein